MAKDTKTTIEESADGREVHIHIHIHQTQPVVVAPYPQPIHVWPTWPQPVYPTWIGPTYTVTCTGIGMCQVTEEIGTTIDNQIKTGKWTGNAGGTATWHEVKE